MKRIAFAAAFMFTVSWLAVAAAEQSAAPAGQQDDIIKAAAEAVRQYRMESTPAAAEPVQSPPPAVAPQQDDVLKAIDEAGRQYKADDFAGAVSNLDYAGQLIRQKKSERMKALLPEALPGWQAKTATAQILGAAVFGGGATVSRDYVTSSGATVSVEIVSDSPVLQSIIMMLNNPLFAVGSLQTVKGQRAMIKYDEKDRGGEVNVVVAGRFIVTVKGRGIDQPVLVRYAEAVDFEALAKN